MEALLKKYFWLIKLLGVALVVVFAASAGVNMFVSKALLEPATERVAAADEPDEDEDEDEDDIRQRQAEMLEKLSGGAGGPGKSAVERAAETVLGGSIFCPTCAPEPEELAVSPEAAAAGLSGPLRPGEIKSKLPLQLLATMESTDPAYSMATILQTDINVLAPYGVNDTIRAGVVVQRVDRGRVVFRNGAQMEYIELGGMPPPPAAAAPTKVIEEAKPQKNDREIDGAAESINCDADFKSCTVDKAFVEKLLANPAQLTRQARIVPAVRDGETKGYKFYGIRPGSLPRLLGMKNGDLLTSVNGHQLESLDQAMDLYTKLRRASHLSVTIERQGETVQKEIDIK
ncbi:MAG: type II secretion system protein GspC [Enhygromyxa sp.]